MTATAIESGALDGRGLEIAYAADAAEFFFLQDPGLGPLAPSRRQASCASAMIRRMGAAMSASASCCSIAANLQRGQASMQGILDYLRADPVRGAAVMNENPSWVFFRELTGPGPLGALGRSGDRAALALPSIPNMCRSARPVIPVARPRRTEWAVDRARHGRRDQGRQSFRQLLGRGRRGAGDCRRHVGARIGAVAAPARQHRAALSGTLTRSMARRLGPDENALWKKVAATVKPLAKAKAPLAPVAPPTDEPTKADAAQHCQHPRRSAPSAAAKLPPPRRTHGAATLDGHWDRRLRKGMVRPDLSASTFMATRSGVGTDIARRGDRPRVDARRAGAARRCRPPCARAPTVCRKCTATHDHAARSAPRYPIGWPIRPMPTRSSRFVRRILAMAGRGQSM